MELLPLSEDAFYGLPYVVDLAWIEVEVGDPRAAIARLEHLLSLPSWITPAWLRMDPAWALLRGDPRFEAMLRRHEATAESSSRF